MSTLNIKKWAENIISSSKRIAIPIMTHPGIELIDGCTVKQAVTNGEIHAEAIIKLNKAYPSAACTAIMDLTVEAEAFGADVLFAENEIPTIVGRLVHDAGSVSALQVPDLNAGRVLEYLKANRITAENIKDKPVFGGCIGPFSLAGRLFDMSEMMMAMYMEPDTINLLLQKCTDFITKYVLAMKETGVNGVIMAEPAAGLVSNEDSIEFSTKYIKQIIDKVQDENFMVVLHNCGNTGHCTQAMVESGANGLHFGNGCNMEQALAECPSDVIVMGNVDPVGIMKQSAADKVKEVTLSLLEKTSGYKNYVLSTGCDVPPAIPMENVKAFYEALAEYNGKS